MLQPPGRGRDHLQGQMADRDVVQGHEIFWIQHRGYAHEGDRTNRKALAVVCIALVWAYLVGDHKDINVKKIRILKHGHRAKSIVKYGLEEISDVLNRPMKKPKFDIFQFLSCS